MPTDVDELVAQRHRPIVSLELTTLEAYLAETGWVRVASPEATWPYRVWKHTETQNLVRLPGREDFADYPKRMTEALEVIGHIEKRPTAAEQVARDARLRLASRQSDDG